MDNSKYITSDKNYTLLPSIGGFEDSKIQNNSSFSFSQELSFRTLWYTNDTIIDSFSGQTFPTPYDYFRSTGNTFSLTANYKKALDLIQNQEFADALTVPLLPVFGRVEVLRRLTYIIDEFENYNSETWLSMLPIQVQLLRESYILFP